MQQLSRPASLVATAGALALSGSAADAWGSEPILSPAPGTPTAMPSSEISFLGAALGTLGVITVTGSLSGRHSGRLRSYSSAVGAGFRPNRPFTPGERVSVRARWRSPSGATVSLSSSFTVARPVAVPAPALVPVGAEAEAQSFLSAPELHPPKITVHHAGDGTPGYLLAAPGSGGAQSGPMIFAEDGALVWFKALPAGEQAADFRTQDFHGKNDLTWWEGSTNSLGYGRGQDVIVNANYRPVSLIRAGNGLAADEHRFIVGSEGTAWLLAYSPVRSDLGALGGSSEGTAIDGVIQEIDIHTGMVMWEWHSLGHISPSESYLPAPAGAGTPYDYLHLDSLDLDSHGNLLISARNTSALYAIDGRTGAVLWRLGGRRSSFRLGAGVSFANPEDATFQPGHEIGLIDGGGTPGVGGTPRGEVIKLDEGASSTSLALGLPRPSGAASGAGADDLQALPGGGWLTGWGTGGELTEFNSRGTIVYDAGLSTALDSHSIYREPWAGLPGSAPALRVLTSGSISTVYASWNGATVATSWQLLTGPDPSHMTPVSSTPWSGFETAIPAPAAAFYEVRALSASGRVLRASPVARGSL